MEHYAAVNSQRGVRDPGELFSIRIGDANRYASEFLTILLRGPDAMPCTKRSDAAGREDLAMKQVPMALELANADDP